MKKYKSISINQIERTYYESAGALAKHLAGIVGKTGKAISLFTDYRWHTEGCVMSPYAGYVTTLSLGYDGPFSEKELMEALRKEGIYANPVKGQSSVYVLYTENVGSVWPQNIGCAPE